MIVGCSDGCMFVLNLSFRHQTTIDSYQPPAPPPPPPPAQSSPPRPTLIAYKLLCTQID